MGYPMVVIHFTPLKSGQSLYSGQISWSQRPLYRGATVIILTSFNQFLMCVVKLFSNSLDLFKVVPVYKVVMSPCVRECRMQVCAPVCPHGTPNTQQHM